MFAVLPSSPPFRVLALVRTALIKSRFLARYTSGTPVLLGASCIPLLLLAASYLGHWLPVGDSLSVFRTHLEIVAAITSAILFTCRKSRAGVIVAAFVLASALPAPGVSRTGLPVSSAEYSIYQKNLLIGGETPEAIAADIIQASADFVALQELSPQNRRALVDLFGSYRNTEICPGRKDRGVAILTNREIVEGSVRCFPDLDLVLVQVDVGSENLWIGSVHLRWPYPHGQHAQAKVIAKVIAGLEGQIIIAGDFNMVRHGSSVRRIEDAAGARVAGDVSMTFPRFAPLVPLAIDHVLLPEGAPAVVETRPLLGSDHLGLLARFSL